MRAWRVHQLGSPTEALSWEELPDPEPGLGQLLVQVEAASLNFPDVLLCAGLYQVKPPLPFTPGLEVAGTVLAAGEGTRTPVGTRVMGLPGLPDGGLAEQVLLADAAALPVPGAMTSAQASTIMLTYQTGWVGLHRRAHLQAGETLLVHAGAGGVGSAAIQIGKAAGARVIATAGGPEKKQACLDLGADIAIDYSSESFVDVVKEATGGEGADVIYDPVGGDVFDQSRKCIAFEGRLVVVGFTSGRIPDAPANHALVKNYSVVGLHWGLYWAKDPSAIVEAHEGLMRMFDDGQLRPLIGAQRPLSEAPAALDQLASRKTVGKVVLVP